MVSNEIKIWKPLPKLKLETGRAESREGCK